MKYTQNITNKNLNIGFKLKYNHADDEINYEVYENGGIEVTVDHTNKIVYGSVTSKVADVDFKIKSIGQLLQSTTTINSLIKQA